MNPDNQPQTPTPEDSTASQTPAVEPPKMPIEPVASADPQGMASPPDAQAPLGSSQTDQPGGDAVPPSMDPALPTTPSAAGAGSKKGLVIGMAVILVVLVVAVLMFL